MSNVFVDVIEFVYNENQLENNICCWFLIVVMLVVGGVGVVGVVVFFIVFWNLSVKVKVVGVDVEVDISGIEFGQLVCVMW